MIFYKATLNKAFTVSAVNINKVSDKTSVFLHNEQQQIRQFLTTVDFSMSVDCIDSATLKIQDKVVFILESGAVAVFTKFEH